MVFMAHDALLEADTCFAEAARLAPHSPQWPYGRSLLEMDRDRLPFLRQAVALAETWPSYRSPSACVWPKCCWNSSSCQRPSSY